MRALSLVESGNSSCYNRSMSMPEIEENIWHREIPWTSWMRGLSCWLIFSFLMIGGSADFVFAVVGFTRNWFATSAKWMGAGPWFQFVLTLQNGLSGGATVFCAFYWLRNRDMRMALMSGVWICGFGTFIGPTHAPTDESAGSIFWIRYVLSLLMIVLGCTVMILEHRKPKALARSIPRIKRCRQGHADKRRPLRLVE